VFGARPQELKGRAVFVLKWSPMDEIGGAGEMDSALAPVHPIVAVDLGGDEPAFGGVEAGDDACGFVFERGILWAGKLEAVPCLVQWSRSGEVAMPTVTRGDSTACR